jgi:two-component system, OmpR family, phosphate regulon sensor histidine kinase PhoR
LKNSTIRLIIVLATLSIIGITITQIYWVKRAFDLKEAEFDRQANTALLNVAQQLFAINNTPSPANNPVKQVSTNYYVVIMNSEIDAPLLEFLLTTEFEKRNIKADFEYGIYDCTHEKMVYGDYVSLKESNGKIEKRTNLPKWATASYYFGVQFPNRESQILNQMGIWSFSSVVLLLVIVFFAYTLFVILKQKRLSEIQKDFINNMTHEFKTPIATIAVSTEVLKSPAILQQPERLHNYTTIIENENNRLKQHVERVLQMARLEKEEVSLKREELNFYEILDAVINAMSLNITEGNGRITTNYYAVQATVLADKHHVTNVVSNLIDNAVKYCDHTPEIIVRTHNEANYFVLQIIDNGIGISPENQKKIFQKFYRVPTGNVHNVKGFGLGLNYVKQIVEAHRGRISVQSKEGNGSTFTIFFPLK